MTRTLALAGSALALRPALREQVISEADRAESTTVLPGLAHGEEAVAALPAGATVRAVLTDQLSLLNAAYCQRILQLHHALSFPAWVEEHLDEVLFAPEELLAPVLARPDLRLEVVVLDGDVLDAELPGPVLVSATRVLHKRLRAAGAFHRVGRAPLVRHVTELQAAAAEQEWDDTVHWGWTEQLRQQAVDHFAAGNATFAGRTDRSDWPPAPPPRPTVTAQLSDTPPPVVYGVMTAIEAAVREHPTPAANHRDPATGSRRLRSRLRRRLRRALRR